MSEWCIGYNGVGLFCGMLPLDKYTLAEAKAKIGAEAVGHIVIHHKCPIPSIQAAQAIINELKAVERKVRLKESEVFWNEQRARAARTETIDCYDAPEDLIGFIVYLQTKLQSIPVFYRKRAQIFYDYEDRELTISYEKDET